MFNRIDFMENASNVYRTKNYIIKQVIVFVPHTQLDNNIISQDTYYLRTKQRDMLFDKIFRNKFNSNGKRMHTTSNSKKYVF